MEKPVAAIELCSKSVKIVIGYVLDGKVHVLYTLTKEVGPLIDRGNIVDPTALKGALESIALIDDPSVKLKINVSDALLAIPPYGVEVYQTKPVVTIISEDVTNIKFRDSTIFRNNSDYRFSLIDFYSIRRNR